MLPSETDHFQNIAHIELTPGRISFTPSFEILLRKGRSKSWAGVGYIGSKKTNNTSILQSGFRKIEIVRVKNDGVK